MKNREAKILMLGCVRQRENGECYILTNISIQSSWLEGGPTLSKSKYIGHIGMIDEPIMDEIESEVRDFCQKLNLSKKETERAIAIYPKEYVPVKSDDD
ncbi:hypothetical protein QX249_12260 [Vibrio parahaemolyticus]|uniref:Uncharacterized protein n=1 Tax=Vibrio parahaemolyticus TaxID=670 RepID=A0AAW8Q0T3_VIBPH|nr:hypothetical protein [Vibrio parahaemolyticus]MDS1821436.1 hypothetical protein [Vibrio parahaemolyticus]